MAVTKSMLLAELQEMLRLTSFEQTIATVRRSQAASTPIAEELAANAAKSAERQQLLADAIRQAGGVPDVVGAALGRAGAFLQTQVNQVQTLQGALLGDLALEHSLRERARYARTLAESLGYSQVLPVLDRLETAHTATIEWLEIRLAEVGRTGTSAIRATPVQAAVAVAWRTAGAPFSVFAAGVNRASSLLARKGAQAVDTAQDVAGEAVGTAQHVAAEAADSAQQAAGRAADTASDLAAEAADTAQQAAGRAAGATASAVDTTADAAGEAADTAADAVSAAADRTADATGRAADGAGEVVDETAGTVADATDDAAERVLDLTDVDADQEPFPAYRTLTGDSVMRHAADSDDVEHLREVLAYERAHKSRKGVLQAVESRLAELSTSV